MALPRPKVFMRHGGAAGVKILRIGRENLAALWLDEVAPEPGGMHVAGGESALEGEMVFLAGRQRVEFQHFQPEQVGQVMG